MTQSPRYRSIDAWRGLAALSVLLWHRYYDRSKAAAELWLGVQVFFVISGYCIAAATDRALADRRTIGAFLRRRVRRIAPPYYGSLAMALMLRGVFSGRGALLFPPRIWAENLTMTQWLASARFWWHTRAGFRAPWLNGHYLLGVHWSLNYEEQFYLLAGLLLLAAAAGARPALLFAALTSGCALIAYAQPGRVTGFFFDYWLQFACGALVFFRLCKLESPGGRRLFDACAALALAVVVATAWHRGELPPENEPVQTFGPLTVCILFSLLLVALRPLDSWLCRQAPVRLFAGLGLFSYSLYLIHQELLAQLAPVDAFLRPMTGQAGADLLVLLLVVCFAWMFFMIFERPFLQKSTRPGADPGTP